MNSKNLGAERLVPVDPVNADPAPDHAPARPIAPQPNPSMAKGVAQNLMAQPGLAKSLGNIPGQAVERPPGNPAAGIPPTKR